MLTQLERSRVAALSPVTVKVPSAWEVNHFCPVTNLVVVQPGLISVAASETQRASRAISRSLVKVSSVAQLSMSCRLTAGTETLGVAPVAGERIVGGVGFVGASGHRDDGKQR